MLKVEIRKGQSVEKALKIFKRKVKDSGIMFELKERSFYKKPSAIKREQISPMGYNLLRKDVIMLKDAVKYLERSVKKQHQADTHHDLIYLLTRAHEAYKNSKK